eukprot:5638042-Pyramimonas_sp.AAC.1
MPPKEPQEAQLIDSANGFWRISKFSPFQFSDAPRRPKRLYGPLQDSPRSLEHGPRGPQDGARGAHDGPRGPYGAPLKAPEGVSACVRHTQCSASLPQRELHRRSQWRSPHASPTP